MSLRTPVIAGNWKMNLGPVAAARLVRELLSLHASPAAGTMILFPPSISFAAARSAGEGRSDVRWGVQNIHWEERGAFTGEISGSMAREAGAEFTLVGHSERRQLFGDTDAVVAKKTGAALRAELIPIVCVGETLEERRGGQVEAVILRQLDAVLEEVNENIGRCLLAYEPVWAIGTGVVATPDDAEAAHAVLRRRLDQRNGPEAAAGVPILYGGSVKADNAAGLLARTGVDGLLVGGASLDPAGFAAIAQLGGAG